MPTKDPRCRRRHHDWDDQGACRRAGCTAKRPSGTPTTPAQPETPETPADPLAHLFKEAPKPEATAKPKVKESGKFRLFRIVPPAVVTGTIKTNQLAMGLWKLETDPPPQEAKDEARQAVDRWITEKWGNGPELGPFGEMAVALFCLSSGLWFAARKKGEGGAKLSSVPMPKSADMPPPANPDPPPPPKHVAQGADVPHVPPSNVLNFAPPAAMPSLPRFPMSHLFIPETETDEANPPGSVPDAQ